MAGGCGSETEEAEDEEANNDKDDDSCHSGVVRDHYYTNWVKAAEVIGLLQQGLAPFVDREIFNKHTLFLKKVLFCVQGTSSCGCTFKNILPDHDISTCSLKKCLCKVKTKRRRKCPQNDCSTFLQMILNEHKTGDPLGKNTNIHTWPTDHWSIARCYMTTPTFSNSAQMTDASGLLSIILNGKFFQSKVASLLGQPGDCFLKMELTDPELQDTLDTCIAVLRDPASLLHDNNACLLVQRMEKIRNDELKVTTEEEREILYQRTEALKQMIQEVGKAKTEALESIEAKRKQAVNEISRKTQEIQETGSGVLESIDTRTGKLKQMIQGVGEARSGAVESVETKRKQAVNEISRKAQEIQETGSRVLESIDTRTGELKQMIQRVKEDTSKAVESVEAKRKQAVDEISRTVQKVQETGSEVLESIDAKRTADMEDLNKLNEMKSKVKCPDSGAVKYDATACHRQIEEPSDSLPIIETKIQVCVSSERFGRHIPDTEQEPLETKLSAIQHKLANHLRKHYTTTSLSPLKTRENDVRIDEVYTEPKMEIEEKPTERDKDKTNNRLKLESYSDIFENRSERPKRIYVLGELGTGRQRFVK